MKTIKQLLTTIAVLLCSVVANAHDFKVDGIYYNITSSKNLKVEVTYRGLWSDDYSNEYSGNVVIPEKVVYEEETYTVTSIGESAFENCNSLTSVTIPNSVTSIRGSAFKNCYSLTSVTIPNSVTYIGKEAFIGCNSLKTLIWNAKNCADFDKSYQNRTFPTSITSVVFGDSVEHIPCYLLYYFPNYNDLQTSSKITSITIPKSVTSIGEGAFYCCSNLTSVNISDITSWYNIDFQSKNSNPLCYAKNLYLNGEKVTDLIILEGIDSIKNYAFCGGECITSLTIPNSVTYIGRSAFEDCNSLSSINIPNSVTYIGESAFSKCSSLTSIEMPNSVTSIGEWAFNDCNTLLNVNISDMTAWCNINFANWYSNPARNLYLNGEKITNLIIPEGVDSIKDYAFYNCNSLTSVTIPNSVTYIGESAFEDCEFLTSVTIPNSVTYIGERAFEDCNSLSSITWNVKNYPHSCDVFPTSITSFTFGDNVEHIPDYLCQDMSKLTSITIGNNVTSIGKWAFENCNNLRTIQIGESIKTIEKGAFAGCTALYSISVDAIISPIIDKTTFTDVSRTAQIKVPCNAVAAYQASNYWNEFSNYIESPYTLTVNVNDATMGVAVITKQATCQDITAQVQAQALPGYEFVKWSDGFTENPHTVYVISDTTITAEFRIASTPVENIFNSQISFYTTDGTLHIEGIESDYQIYSTTGQCVYSGKETTLTLPRGIYLITINGKTDKLHVK